MIYTNNQKLPDPFPAIIKNDPYSGSGFTASMLPQPIQIYELKRRYKDKVEVDIADMIYPLLGNNTHYILERMGIKNALQEERLFAVVNGEKVSGQIDYYSANRALQDWKVTTRYVLIDGVKPDWECQLNINAFLLEINKFKVDKIEVVCIFRDWSKIQSLKNPDYPKHQVAVLPVFKWSMAEREEYISMRIDYFKEAMGLPDSELPECSAEERWEKKPVYAVMKKGRKSAVRLLGSEEEAAEYIGDKNLDPKIHSIQFRQGESTRCEYYCDVKDFCNQYKKMKG